MKNSLIALGTFFLLLFAQSAHAETSWDKMLKLYSNAENYSMEIAVNMKITGEADPVIYKGTVKESEGNYYSSIEGITTVYGPNYWVIAYESTRTMYYGKSNPDVQKSMIKDQTVFADSLLKLSSKPRLKSKNGDEEIYVYDMKEGIYSSVEYTIQISTGYMTKVVYFYKASQDVSYEKVTIDYSAISVNQGVADSFFSEKTYFSEKKGTASGIGKYLGYKIIDQDKLVPAE
jgi:hypothetical protein